METATLLPVAVLMPRNQCPKTFPNVHINNVYDDKEIVTINLFDLDFFWM